MQFSENLVTRSRSKATGTMKSCLHLSKNAQIFTQLADSKMHGYGVNKVFTSAKFVSRSRRLYKGSMPLALQYFSWCTTSQ